MTEMTEKLYYRDATQLEFTARVVGRREVAGRPAVILDQTCFYPTGGGQPNDRGELNAVDVLDVILDETTGELLHVLAGPLAAESVTGRVDRARRLDHTQQHTGQHILSEAFVRRLRAATVSFHLGDEYSTIDVDRAPLDAEELRAVEESANRIVWENRPITARFVTRAELAQLPLRKPPTVEGPIRVVEVADFDWSACGGTHCRAAGEVGLIRIAGAERRGNDTRVTFLCGRRALEDYRRKDAVLTQLAGQLTTSFTALPEVVQKMDADLRTAGRELQKAQAALAALEAEAMLARAEPAGAVRLIVRAFDDRDFMAVKQLAGQLLSQAGVIVLLGWKGPEKGQLLFGRSADVGVDMLALLRSAGKAVGGGGGGRPDMAQGGGMPSARVEEALALAGADVRRQLGVRP
jgi:alanyl-tRNA synthetase